ncbi:cytochrome P450 [Mycena olivaceomarginata]|nr:cytochrome P450 [Mycena olivaceomarginata]
MLQLMLPRQYGDHEFRWLKQFGSVYRLKGCFGQDRLLVGDPLAMQYILGSPLFGRAGVLYVLSELLFGKQSVIGADGDEHRRIRAGLNVGFTATAVRNYQPVFEKVAEAISEQWGSSSGSMKNICPLLTRATLDSISQVVLGYPVQELGNEFLANNTQIVKLTATQSATQILVDALSLRLPLWLWPAAIYLPTTAFNVMRRSKHLANKVGHETVDKRLNAVRRGLEMNNDLFSRLLDPDISDKLSADDVVAQLGFILLAGQETTANALSFGLLELAKHPAFQDKLRAEIHSALEASAGTVAYDNMPLLNAFLKETLRLYPAVPFVERVALQDVTIPLADPITTSTLEQTSHFTIQKGQHITLGIGSYQRLESRWGTDSHEFNPSRWLDDTIPRRETVGPYSNLMSFLGGPRTCLGWRFAILEMQVIFCHLVSKFSFAEVEGESIRVRLFTTLVPIGPKGEKALPLRVARI